MLFPIPTTCLSIPKATSGSVRIRIITRTNFCGLNGKELKRFGSWPSGAEVTGLRIEPNGAFYLRMCSTHPPMNKYPFTRGVVGAVTGYVAGDDFAPVDLPKGADAHQVKLAAGEYQVWPALGKQFPVVKAKCLAKLKMPQAQAEPLQHAGR